MAELSWFSVPLRLTIAAEDEALAAEQARETLTAIVYAGLELGVELEATLADLTADGEGFYASLRLVALASDAAEAERLLGEACARYLDEEQAVTLGTATPSADPRLLDDDLKLVLSLAVTELLEDIDDDLELMLEHGLAFAETITLPDLLPPVYAGHYTPLLITQWRGAVANVSAKLAAYPDTYLATTAEELAGHALIGRAEEIVDRYADGDPELAARLSRGFDYRQAKERLDDVHEAAFEDWDVLMLFDASLDGVGEPGEAIGEQLGTANLHVSAWFTPFQVEGPAPDAEPGHDL